MRCTVAYTRHQSLSRCSGYDLIARHLEATEMTARRGDPSGGLSLLTARLLRRGAASRWYQGSSARVEWDACCNLRKEKPDILHYLWADSDLGYLPWVKHSLSPHTRLVGTLHNPPAQLDQVLRFPRILQKFDALILMSSHQREHLLRAGLSPDRLHVIPHGIDTDFFHPPSLPIQPSKFRVLSVGGYLRDFALLHAVCSACANQVDIEFQIIGPPAKADQFANLPNVIFRHGLSDDELAEVYRSSSCLLLTLIDATANNSLLEAMASGLPVVTENLGGVSDYADESTALFAPPKSVHALVAAIRRLADDTALADRLGWAGRQKTEALAWPMIAARTRELYQSLLSSGSGR